MMERVKTGIQGLDQILNGGLVKNRVIVVQGSAGTGKTTLGLQFLSKGAEQGEPGLLLSMEYDVKDIISDMKAYGWNPEQQIEESKLRIITPPGGFEDPQSMNIDDLINLIFEHVQETKAKRLVIDSINSMEIALGEDKLDRKDLLRFTTLLRDLDCTTLLIAEKFDNQKDLVYGYLSHGIIELYNIRKGASRLRGLEIIKMRGVEHSNLTHSLSIEPGNGIIVHPHEIDLGL
ncbi:MAG: RAD55 family ATPase [Candidatus Kariarchaeaceae archaeon]|jgi:KaiC/GvpD/RAD55 family RecA-like ATPase